MTAIRRAPVTSFGARETRVALLLLALGLAGCGHNENATTVAQATSPPAASPAAEAARTPPAPARRVPATAAEAAQVLDLASFPMAEGARLMQPRTLAQLSYEAPGEVAKLYASQRAALVAEAWVEAGESQISDQSGSGLFGKQGFTVSLTVMPGSSPEACMVLLKNHGNVQFDQLPLPQGLSPVYQGGHMAIYAGEPGTDLAAPLLADGWLPYGSAGDTQWLRQHAIRLSLTTSAPVSGGKANYTLQAELLSAEIPAPAEVAHLQYDDARQQLSFSSTRDFEAVLAATREVLAPLGWNSSLAKPTTSDSQQVMTFRNAASDLLTLSYGGTGEGGTRGVLAYQSKAQLDAMNAELDRQAAAYLRARGQ